MFVRKVKDQSILAKYYSLVVIFLFFSHRETYLLTCLEALSCGTPIAGIDEGGTKETAPFLYGLFRVGNTTQLEKDIIAQLDRRLTREDVRDVAVMEYLKRVTRDSYSLLQREILYGELNSKKEIRNSEDEFIF